MIRALGSDFLLPGAPEQSKKAPMDAAVPKQTVEACKEIKRMARLTQISSHRKGCTAWYHRLPSPRRQILQES
eukprot:768404-Hanusia_phi.AAC.2